MSDNTKTDERLVKAADTVTRQDRSAADAERTQQDGTAYTTEERRKLARSEWMQEVLPTPPKVPGWHYCWLSTTNTSDPIYKRLQRGYELVKYTEVPGFGQFKATSGEFEGCVACNEMILAKIPQELYQEYMTYFHHELPMDEEEMLRNNALTSDQDSNGRELGQVEGEGFKSLGRRVRTPHFS